MPLQNRPPRRKKKNDQRWILPALLIPVVLAVAGLQWWQTHQPPAPIPLPPSEGRLFDAETPAAAGSAAPSASGDIFGSRPGPTRNLQGPPVPIGQGNVQTFTPKPTEAPMAAPRQIGSYERLPEAGAAQRSADDGQRHPLCDSLDKQRKAAEEQLQAATSPSEKRTFTHERDTALQNLKSLGCFN